MQPLVVLQRMAVHVDAVTCDFVVEVEQKQVHCWTWWLGQRLLLKACPWTFQVAVCESGPVAYQSSEMRPLVVLQHVAVLVDAVTCDFVVEVEQKQVHCWTWWLEQLATKKLFSDGHCSKHVDHRPISNKAYKNIDKRSLSTQNDLGHPNEMEMEV